MSGPRWDQYIGRLPPMGRKVLLDNFNQVQEFRRKNKVKAPTTDGYPDHPITAQLIDSASSKVRTMYPENFRVDP